MKQDILTRLKEYAVGKHIGTKELCQVVNGKACLCLEGLLIMLYSEDVLGVDFSEKSASSVMDYVREAYELSPKGDMVGLLPKRVADWAGVENVDHGSPLWELNDKFYNDEDGVAHTDASIGLFDVIAEHHQAELSIEYRGSYRSNNDEYVFVEDRI